MLLPVTAMRIAAVVLASLLSLSVSAQQVNDVIVPLAGAPQLLLPVAGNTPGGNGTYFRSDVHLLNLRDVAQRVEIYYLPQAGTGTLGPTRTVDIPALSGLFSEDFVNNILSEDGLGAIQFIGVTPTGQVDPNARIHVASRIWTPRPDGAAGTYSQSFPTVVLPSGITSDVRWVFGMRHGPQYRLNVGVANVSQAPQRFRVTLRLSGAAGTEATAFEMLLQPFSIEQRGTTLALEGVVQVLVERITGGSATEWHTWASSVDNASGDAWSNLGFGAQ